jgi:CheY-like chemotaxis protein
MNARLLLVALEREPDIVLVRKRTRRVAELLGFDRQDRTRITTAVSELARNAFEYAGGGRAEFDRLTGNRSTTRVLLVDDEEVTRYLVRQLLPRGVYDVRESRSGTEGLAQLLNEPPDVVLLDLKMPEMTGFELLDRISDETSLDAVPAIVLTSAILTPEEQQRLRRAARIMSKSDLSGSALTGAIIDALNKSPSEAA